MASPISSSVHITATTVLDFCVYNIIAKGNANTCMLRNTIAMQLELSGALQSTNQIEPSEIPQSSNVLVHVVSDLLFRMPMIVIHAHRVLQK